MARQRKATPDHALVVRDPTCEHAGQAPLVATPAGLAKAGQLARLGHSLAGIAAALGMSKETLRQARRRQPELDSAIDAGLAELEQELVHTLLEQARKGVYAAAMFLLKTRHGYREQGATDGDQGPRVGITFNLPGALPAEAYAKLVEVAPLPAPASEGREDD